MSGFWLWFKPPTVQVQSDPRAVAEALKAALIEAIKTAKEPAKQTKNK